MFDSTRRPTHRRPTALERAAVVLVATALTWATGRQTVRAADDTTAPGRTSEEIRRNWGTETAKDGETFPWEGEEFYYSLRINGAEALRASLKTGRLRESGDRRYVPLALRVRSVGWFDEMYPVDDRGDTYLDPTTFRPYYSEKRFDEGGEVITYRVDFRRGEYRARVAKRRPNKLHEFTMPLPAATHDMMTWLYDFRRHRLERGDSFQYYVYDGWKLSDVRLKVQERVDLYTPDGWYKAWRLSFVRKVVRPHPTGEESDGPPRLSVKTAREHAGSFWVSRDAHHLPLRITMRTDFGSGEAILIRYDRHDD